MTKQSRILVVDDEPGMLRAVERVLGGAHRVIASQSSRDALSLAVEFKPHLAILDIRMPELDGFELMAGLKSQQPGIDVILMTGSLEDQDEKLIRSIRGHAFYFIQKPFDREVLKTLVDRCLELRWHREENQRHVQRLKTELSAARVFQQSLLPAREAVTNGLAICCRYTPCSELGGDLYDYSVGRPGRTALLIADVAGHGASAAMLTGIVKSAFRASHVDDYDPLCVVDRVWNNLTSFSPERFVTLIAVVIAAEERQLIYINAGHPPGLLWGGTRRMERLESTGPIVSPALPASQWERLVVPIEEGDQLLLYTDGVSEAQVGDDDFGEKRIRAEIERHPAGGAELVDGVLVALTQHLGNHPLADDLTLVTARVLQSTRSL